jgi:hypothetical protein
VVLRRVTAIKDRRPRVEASTCRESRSKGIELPTAKAFVLQLSRETGPTLQPFTGRVEHLSSGRRARFSTLDEFQAAVSRLLREAKT